MTREEIHKVLEEIKNYIHDQFSGNVSRVAQLDAHLATVDMVVDHIHDEAARAAEGN